MTLNTTYIDSVVVFLILVFVIRIDSNLRREIRDLPAELKEPNKKGTKQ